MTGIKRIHYCDDFKFDFKRVDVDGNAVAVPSHQWQAVIHTPATEFRAWQDDKGIVGAKLIDEYTIRFILNAHGLQPGALVIEFVENIPDADFPDGSRRVHRTYNTGIELVADSEASAPDGPVVTLMLPYIYETAYSAAVSAGYKGSQEEYMALASQLPNAVEVANSVKGSADSLAESAEQIGSASSALGNLVSDWAAGKAKIANALSRKHAPTDASESFDVIAQKVMDLPLAVEGKEDVIDHTANGIVNGYDLLNELHQHQRQDYPYLCGVMFLHHLHKTVTLNGAEAYYCSDGFFTTEQDVEHTFADSDNPDCYIIYYFSYPTYQVPTAINPATQLIAYNGQPRFNLSNYYCPIVRSFSNEKYSVGSTELTANNTSYISDLMFCGIEKLNNLIDSATENSSILNLSFPHAKKIIAGGVIARSLSRLKCLSLPMLERASGGTLLNSCSAIESLELPKLEEVSGTIITNSCSSLKRLMLPSLKKVSGGTIVGSSSAIESLELPALTEISTGTIVSNCNLISSIALPLLTTLSSGTVISSCPALDEVEFPNLTEIKGGFLCMNSGPHVIRLPKLKSCIGNILHQFTTNITGLAHIYLPQIEGSIKWGSVYVGNFNIAVHLGQQQGCTINIATGSTAGLEKFTVVTVENGFRSNLDLHLWTSITTESLQDIIDNLADNNDYEPLTLTLGATLKAKLSEEYIAIAVAKNYNIA